MSERLSALRGHLPWTQGQEQPLVTAPAWSPLEGQRLGALPVGGEGQDGERWGPGGVRVPL